MLVDFRALTSSCLKEDEEKEFVRDKSVVVRVARMRGCSGGGGGNEGNVITPAAR